MLQQYICLRLWTKVTLETIPSENQSASNWQCDLLGDEAHAELIVIARGQEMLSSTL